MDVKHTCCVTGHRDIPADKRRFVADELLNEILSAIQEGYTRFISGFAGGVDLMFAEIVAELKSEYAITLEAAIPYPGRMKTPDATFQRLIEHCDVVKIHSNEYLSGCYSIRNRYMVDNSERVIAVYDGRKGGGSAQTIRYAEAEGRDVRYIYI